MTLAVAALFADGTTTLSNIASWRVKETDRIAAMATELRKVGATVEEGPDYIRVTPPAALTPNAVDRHLRRPPHGDVLWPGSAGRRAGAHQRPQVRGQDFPGLFQCSGRNFTEKIGNGRGRNVAHVVTSRNRKGLVISD